MTLSDFEENGEQGKIRTFIKGGGQIFLAAFLLLATISYSQNDASMNRASDGDFYNLTGKMGSYIVDPLLQHHF